MVDNNSSRNKDSVASSDELGIFIDGEGNYRILLPNSWTASGEVPEFAYLVIAALVRLARRNEVEFRSALATWARQDLTQSPELRFPPSLKRPN